MGQFTHGNCVSNSVPTLAVRMEVGEISPSSATSCCWPCRSSKKVLCDSERKGRSTILLPACPERNSFRCVGPADCTIYVGVPEVPGIVRTALPIITPAQPTLLVSNCFRRYIRSSHTVLFPLTLRFVYYSAWW